MDLRGFVAIVNRPLVHYWSAERRPIFNGIHARLTSAGADQYMAEPTREGPEAETFLCRVACRWTCGVTLKDRV